MLNTVSTDDAYVNGYVTRGPRVPGQVSRVLVDDNYRVKKGDLLVQLDREPYQVQVELKRAAVVGAEADRKTAEALVRANLEQRRGAVVKDYRRPWNRSTTRSPSCGTRGSSEEQGGDARSRGADLDGADTLFSRRGMSAGRNSISVVRTIGRLKPRSNRPLKKSMKPGSPSACRRTPRRGSCLTFQPI